MTKSACLEPKAPRKWKGISIHRVLTYGLLCIWSLICLFPLYWIAIASLKGPLEIDRGPFYLPFVDFEPSIEAWVFVLNDSRETLLRVFLNSTIVAVVSTTLTLLVGGLAVYGLTRFRWAIPWRSIILGMLLAAVAIPVLFFPTYRLLSLAVLSIAAFLIFSNGFSRRGPVMGSGTILVAILATRILPPVVVVLPIYLMAHYSGMLDTRSGLILAYSASNLPVAVWLLHRIFGDSVTDQEESAQIDGASHIRIFIEIFVPMVAASVAAVGLLILILCWNEYLFAAYLSSQHAMTLPPWVVGLMSAKESQVGAEAEEWSHMSAAVVVMVIPILACVVVAQRLLRPGAMLNR